MVSRGANNGGVKPAGRASRPAGRAAADDRARPIGVFDSGIGGLTVLKALVESLPHEDFIYLGDTARLPYGTKSREVIVQYSRENTGFLLAKGIKLLVVACNTASAVALDEIARETMVPVVGVIEPGAQAALRATRSGKIGVIGTEATIASGAYTRALQRMRPGVEIYTRPCPLLVPLVEEGWTEGEVAERTVGLLPGKPQAERNRHAAPGLHALSVAERDVRAGARRGSPAGGFGDRHRRGGPQTPRFARTGTARGARRAELLRD